MIKFNLVNFLLEAKYFKKLGLPILGSQLVMYAMTTTDYIMAGYYSANDLAGVGLGASIFNPLYFLTAGVMFGIGPLLLSITEPGNLTRSRLKLGDFYG